MAGMVTDLRTSTPSVIKFDTRFTFSQCSEMNEKADWSKHAIKSAVSSKTRTPGNIKTETTYSNVHPSMD